MPFDLIPPAVASAAAVIDIRSRRIPNWLTLSAFVGGLLLQLVRHGAQGVLVGLGGAALGFALLFPFYVMRAVGAGDVKLLAGLGAIVGPQAVVSVLLYGALVGGAISVVLLARRGTLRRSLGEMVTTPTAMTRSGVTAPYGVAIASGVYLSMVLPGVIG